MFSIDAERKPLILLNLFWSIACEETSMHMLIGFKPKFNECSISNNSNKSGVVFDVKEVSISSLLCWMPRVPIYIDSCFVFISNWWQRYAAEVLPFVPVNA